MKYNLPGVYLGNISLDLLMEYMTSDDLSNQSLYLDYMQTSYRKDNMKFYKVTFPYNGKTYQFYTYDIAEDGKIREFVRRVFSDLISSEDIETLIFTKDLNSVYPQTEKGYQLFDTIGMPTVYGPYLEAFMSEPRFMVKAVSSSDMSVTLDTYEDVRNYLDSIPMEFDAQVTILDIRATTPLPIVEYVSLDRDSLNEKGFTYTETIYNTTVEPPVPESIRSGYFYFGNLAMVNDIVTIDGKKGFIYKNTNGLATTIPKRNAIKNDILKNRELTSSSLKNKIYKYLNRRGMAVPVGDELKEMSIVKYDNYTLKKTYSRVSTIPTGLEINYEDLDPKYLVSVGTSHSEDLDTVDNLITLINVNNLPKAKVVVVGNSTSGYKTFCYNKNIDHNNRMFLAEMKVNPRIEIVTKNNTTTFAADYNLSSDGNTIYKTFKDKNNRILTFRMITDENDSTGYVTIVSSTLDKFSSIEEIKQNFKFEDLGITGMKDSDFFPSSYISDGFGGIIPEKWSVMFRLPDDQNFLSEVKSGKRYLLDNPQAARYIDVDLLEDKAVIEFPINIRFDVSGTGAHTLKDVMVTANFKNVNNYSQLESINTGYWATTTDPDYKIKKPDFTEFDLDINRPFNNIRSYLDMLSFDDTYKKEYVVINKYDQQYKYKVTEQVVYNGSASNPAPYNNTFLLIESKVKNNIISNELSEIIKGLTISDDSRGRVIESDILGGGVIESLSKDFRQGFNSLFYGITNYGATGEYMDVDSETAISTDFLRDSITEYTSLRETLRRYLDFNYINLLGETQTYNITDSFRYGFFSKRSSDYRVPRTPYTDWNTVIDDDSINPNRLNEYQKILLYETNTTDDSIKSQLKLQAVRDRLLVDNSQGTGTNYSVKKKVINLNKDIDNIGLISQAFDSIMDSSYRTTEAISSFDKIDVKKIIIKDDKTREQYNHGVNDFRYLNSKQGVDILIKSYITGYKIKVGE